MFKCKYINLPDFLLCLISCGEKEREEERERERERVLKPYLRSCRTSFALYIVIRDVVAAGMIIIGVREIRLFA